MIGDQSNMLARLKAVLPRWFPDSSPVVDGLLSGLASVHAGLFSLVSYASLQARIKTATDGWLDMIAADFFGSALVRAVNQSDTSLRTRILLSLLRERATRAALRQVLVDLTGREPTIIEPARPADCGAYGGPAVGYGSAGAYGSMALPFQCFVQAKRPSSAGIPLVGGYGKPALAYSTPSQSKYATLADVSGAVTDADIYAAVESVRPAGTTVWVNIAS